MADRVMGFLESLCHQICEALREKGESHRGHGVLEALCHQVCRAAEADGARADLTIMQARIEGPPEGALPAEGVLRDVDGDAADLVDNCGLEFPDILQHLGHRSHPGGKAAQ